MNGHDNPLRAEEMAYIIIRLVEYALEAKEEMHSGEANDFNRGKRLAFYEMIDVINSELLIAGQNPEEYGIDFDPISLLN